MAPDSGPARGWYFVAAAIALTGAAGGAALFRSAYLSLNEPLEFAVPGSFAFAVQKPGHYLLWHDYATRFQGDEVSVDPRLPEGVRIHVVGPQGQVALQPSSRTTTTRLGDTRRVLVDTFDAPVAGSYEITVEGRTSRRVLSIGPDNMVHTFASIVGCIGALLLGFVGSVALAGWTYFGRAAGRTRNQSGRAEMNQETSSGSESDHSLKQLTQMVYALQAASFLVGFSSIAAIIVNYVKRDDVAGTLYESHFRWQIRTFWWSLLWGVIGALLFVLVVGIFILAADAIWFLYRIIKGWLRLNEGKPMYSETG